MMLRTGTSKGGRVYRYYTCSNCATKGKTVCKGRSIPMDKLDTLVTDHLIERLFKPERLAEMLTSLSLRRAEKSQSLNSRLMALQREVSDAEEKLRRLYRLVENELTDLDEVLKDRLDTLKAGRDRAKAALERAKEQSTPQIQISPALIERFGRIMQEHSPQGLCLSGRPTCGHSSTSSRLTTSRSESRAARTCLKRLSWPAKTVRLGVRR